MQCNDIGELLAVRQELSWTQARQVEAHLAHCTACATLARHVERAQRMLQAVPVPTASLAPKRVDDIHRRLTGSGQYRRGRSQRVRFVGSVLISVILVVLLLQTVIVQLFGQPFARSDTSTTGLSSIQPAAPAQEPTPIAATSAMEAARKYLAMPQEASALMTADVQILGTFAHDRGAIVLYTGVWKQAERQEPMVGYLSLDEVERGWIVRGGGAGVCYPRRAGATDAMITFDSTFGATSGVMYGQVRNAKVDRVEVIYPDGTLSRGKVVNGFYAFSGPSDAAQSTVRVKDANGNILQSRGAMELPGFTCSDAGKAT